MSCGEFATVTRGQLQPNRCLPTACVLTRTCCSTPLNGVVASADLLTHTRLTEAQAEHVACIQLCARLLLASVNDLLDYNRIASGKMRLEALPVRPAACVQRIAAVLQPAAAAKNQTLSINVDACIDVWVLGDAQRIDQVRA